MSKRSSKPVARSRGARGALELVRDARKSAAQALERLRGEIGEARTLLEHLIKEERDFVAQLSGGAVSAVPATMRGPRRQRSSRPSKRGPAKADKFYAKLPNRFTLEQARRVAGRLTGISLAQWSRAKKIRKVGNRYAKVAAR